jgi:hypothetical protein
VSWGIGAESIKIDAKFGSGFYMPGFYHWLNKSRPPYSSCVGVKIYADKSYPSSPLRKDGGYVVWLKKIAD